MQEVDSQVLRTVASVLQLGSSPKEGLVLDDGVIQQALGMNDFVRRGGADPATLGIHSMVFNNVHVGAGGLTIAINPYATTTAIPPWDSPTATNFDLWLVAASVRNDTGVLLVNGANLDMTLPQSPFASRSLGTTIHLLKSWRAADEITLSGYGPFVADPDPFIGLRLPRGCTMRFTSQVSAAATYLCECVIARLPAGLGQDVVR